MCHKAGKIKGGGVPGLPAAVAAATSELLTLSPTANVGRAALATITPNLAAVSVLLAGPLYQEQNEQKMATTTMTIMAGEECC